MTKFGNELSASCVIKGGVPQGSRIGPIAFVAHINGLNSILNDSDKNDHRSGTNEDSIDEDLTLFMDDATLSEVINVCDHISGTPIRRSLSNVKKVLDFANLQKMKLNLKKCKEMQLDFRINKTEIPSLTVDNITMEKVSTFKLLGVRIDDNLKWQTNTDRIIKKAVKWLFLLKILKKYGASETDIKRFYASVIRPVLEYGAQVWHGGLTKSEPRI